VRRWARLRRSTFCGYCGVLMAELEPVLVLTISAVKREFLRCPRCAGEPVDYAALLDADRATTDNRRPNFEPLAQIAGKLR
jgi:ribosomal protein S27AE